MGHYEHIKWGRSAPHSDTTVRKIEGVESAWFDLGSDSATVAFDPARTSLEAIAEAIRQAGYEARVDLAEPFSPAKSRSLATRLGWGR